MSGPIDILRDALFGNPPSPVKEPSREGVLAAFSELSGSIGSALAGIVYYATGAQRSADTSKPVGTIGKAANETDFYRREGAGWVVDNSVYTGVAGVVQPLVDRAEDANDAVQATASIIAGSQVVIDSAEELILFADADEKVIAVLRKDGTFVTASGGSGVESARKIRFYTFDGSQPAGQEPLRAYEGADGYNFPTTLAVTISGLPAGGSVRDPDVRRDSAGTYWMAFSLWSFSTGDAYASFGVARSADGIAFTFVGQISVLGVANPFGGTGKANRAWAPQWVDTPGFLGVTLSTNFGENDPATGRSRMTPLLFKVASPDMSKMDYVGRVTGSKVPNNCIDQTIIFHNGLYLGCFKDEAARELHIAYSTSLLTGYDSETTTATMSFGPPVEGPSFFDTGTGALRLYYDRYEGSNVGVYGRESVDGGQTWGAERAVNAPIKRHGSYVIVEN